MDILIYSLVTALKITALHYAFWPGMIFFKVRQAFGRFCYNCDLNWLTKPLFDCLPCMASIWGFFAWVSSGFVFNLFASILIISGILVIIQKFLPEMQPEPDEDE